MKIKFLIYILLALAVQLQSQNVASIDRQGLINEVNHRNDTVYVVNFWATWCSPCIAELGFFEELHRSYSNRGVKVILVNLDFPNQVEKRVIPFVKERGLTASVMNMTELDYNAWIPEVNKEWSGAIPATLLYNRDERKFFAREISRDELFDEVDEFMSK
ncbi:MAG: TlpA disulfide reductase family protein [Bacteroidales bacterium]